MAINHKIRSRNGKTKIIELTRKTAILNFCKECMGFNANEVRHCADLRCPLYPFRTHDPPKDTV